MDLIQLQSTVNFWEMNQELFIFTESSISKSDKRCPVEKIGAEEPVVEASVLEEVLEEPAVEEILVEQVVEAVQSELIPSSQISETISGSVPELWLTCLKLL